ncbi:MAG: aminomethyl transferase family protein [Acidobacteria bacterium]|nr:MAG: aminomethyl transferase family protein [Acidobacteriota bacterium]
MPMDEYHAAREGAALFDRSDAGKIAVAGSDRRAYLHAMLTQDILALEAGTGGYSAFLTPQGRMISDMRVLELGDMVLLDLPSSRVPAVVERLDQFIFSEDVRLGDLTEAFGKLTVAGPRAVEVVGRVVGEPSGAEGLDLRGWPEFRNRRVEWRGDTVVLAASADLGLTAFDLYAERPRLQALAGALVEAGAVPASPSTAEVLRVEAGLPAFGKDMDGDTIPLEAGIEDRAISFTKGCYPGQEVIIRVVHRGHGRVARKLTGLLLDGSGVPTRDDLLRGGDRDAGRVTSAVLSPGLGRPIAIAMLHRDFVEPGTELTVLHGEDRIGATTTALPFKAND